MVNLGRSGSDSGRRVDSVSGNDFGRAVKRLLEAFVPDDPRAFIVVGLVLMLLSMIGWLVYAEVRSRTAPAPITVHETRIDQGTARGGDRVTLYLDRTRHRHCPGIVMQSWYGEMPDGSRIYRQDPVVATVPDATIGRIIDRLTKVVPSTVLPNMRWCYSPTMVYMCPGEQIHIVSQPPACLTVVE